MKYSNEMELDCSMCKYCENCNSQVFYPGCGDKVTGHVNLNSDYCKVLSRVINTAHNGMCDNFESGVKCKCGKVMKLFEIVYDFPNQTNTQLMMGKFICESCKKEKNINIRKSRMTRVDSLYRILEVE